MPEQPHSEALKPYSAKGAWYEIKAAFDKPVEVLIYGDIGESWDGESITGKQLVSDLQNVSAKSGNVRIASWGGSVTDGIAIFNALRRHEAKWTVHIDSAAYSIASLIAMAGDEIEMAENALMMIHAPWSMAVGNAVDLRENADMLDRHAQAMSSSYARNDFTQAQALDLLMDGQDHWFTADEAAAAGLIDRVGPAQAIAASAKNTRFNNQRPPAVAPDKEAIMPTEKPQAAKAEPAIDTPEINVSDIQAKAKSEAMSDLKDRNEKIRAIFKPHMKTNGAQALLDSIIDDSAATQAHASEKLLELMGQGAEPLNKPPSAQATIGLDQRDKFRAAAKSAFAGRIDARDDDRANPLRGMALHEMGKQALAVAGMDSRGLTKAEVFSKVMAEATTDFPVLLSNTANKALQTAYEEAETTWQMFAATSSVSDFKVNTRIRLGSFSNLVTKAEAAAYTAGTFDEESETIQAATKGRYIEMTREMFVNDDLGGFVRMASMLGNAAARTVNADVYALINANPAMADGDALFHANHANLASTGAALSLATLGAGRVAMRTQTDSGGAVLNLRPSYLLVPPSLEDTADILINSASNPEANNSRKHNPVANMADVISDAELTGTAWYLMANASMAPTIEVAFLDGQRSPFIDEEEQFLNDTIQYKVRLDYGVGANDWRGGYKNDGA